MFRPELGEPGVTLIIPCLNEARTIGVCVDQALAALKACKKNGEVLVVDNGSSDQSCEIATARGARVINAASKGYGACLRAGFAAAKFEYLTMADADLSYPFLEFPKLIAELDQGADLVLGNRLRGRVEVDAMPWLNRHLGTPILSWCIRWLYSIPTYDCNSGMRAFRKKDVLAMRLRSSGMELASEMLVRAGQLNLRYREVPISFAKDQRQRRSHLRPWRDGIRHLCLILKPGVL